ncbi:MAG: hypothetical protein Q9172_000233 [Xanthocarpia lactea]
MAGRCRTFIKAVAGTLGIAATPFVAHQLDPAIMDHIEDFIADQVTRVTREKVPTFMPEIPFIPTATVKVDSMLDSNWAYYLGLLMILISLVPTIAQIALALWITARQNNCKEFIIFGKTEEIEEIDEDAMLPSAFKVTTPHARQSLRRELDTFLKANNFKRKFLCSKRKASQLTSTNDALAIGARTTSIAFPGFGNRRIDLNILLSSSRDERLVFAMLLKFMFTSLMETLLLRNQQLFAACHHLQSSHEAIKLLFIALSGATQPSKTLQQSSTSQTIDLCNKDKQINELRVTQQRSDTKIATLMASNRRSRTEMGQLRAQLAEGNQKSGSPQETVSTPADEKRTLPAARNPLQQQMSAILKQRVAELENSKAVLTKENDELKAQLQLQPSIGTCSPGHNIDNSQSSTNENGNKTPNAREEVSGKQPIVAQVNIVDRIASTHCSPIAAGESPSRLDKPVRISSLGRLSKLPTLKANADGKNTQGQDQGSTTHTGEDDVSQGADDTPTAPKKKNRRRLRRRKPRKAGAAEGGATEGAANDSDAGQDVQGDQDIENIQED